MTPQDVSTVLSDLCGPKLWLFCDRCGLRRQYDIQALANKLGNAKVVPLIDELAKRGGCPARPPVDIFDKCALRVKWWADEPAAP